MLQRVMILEFAVSVYVIPLKLDKLRWRKLPEAIAIDPEMLGGKVYLQVARIASVKGGRLEAHSNVLPVDLTQL